MKPAPPVRRRCLPIGVRVAWFAGGRLAPRNPTTRAPAARSRDGLSPLLASAISDARELRQVVEVPVAIAQGEAVLNDERGGPQVVGGNRSALRSELSEERGVLMGRGVVSKEDLHFRTQEEALQDPLVVAPLLAEGE